jgi:trans-2,3-dihydro-3-hydroxyanthranilate isomerase
MWGETIDGFPIMTTRYRYLHLDVFTAEKFGGNQLAVFVDARGLSTGQMQAASREMNFSESTFILPAERPDTDIRMRIFTPGCEMPMAGHPTVGSAFALAIEGVIPAGRRRWVFGLNIGPTPVDIDWDGERPAFAWMTQQRPVFGPTVADVEAAARAVGLDGHAVRATGLPVQQVSCGVPFVFIPLATRADVDAATPDLDAFNRLCEASGADNHAMFLFTPERGPDDAAVYSRMFAPGLGIFEDPATGSASGPLGCYLVTHGVVPPGRAGSMLSLQGVKMGRPSRVHVAIGLDAGEITRVQVGGEAVLVGEGYLEV